MPKINFSNLKNLKLNNTSELEKLRSNVGIEKVELVGSKVLSIASFRKQVPEVLLKRNNMADYTKVNLNGQPISESNIEKLKNGYMRINDGDVLEILDGCLEGNTFVISIGLPIHEVIKDITIANHIKERLGKSSLNDRISGYDLDSITWLGKDPNLVTDDDYFGYFRNKVITEYSDLSIFNNLEYINFAGAIIPSTVKLSDFRVGNFKYSFANCVAISSIILDKSCSDTSYTFKGCTGLSVVDMRSEFSSNKADRMLMGCVGILELTAPADSSGISYEYDMFEGGRVESLKLEISDTFDNLGLFHNALNIAKKLDLKGHKRPDTLPITSSVNNSILELDMSDTDIVECVLKNNPNMNFTGLQKVYIRNTPNLKKIVASDNLYNMYVDNSGLLEYKTLYDTKLEVLSDTSNLNYTRLQIDGIDVDNETLTLIKSGEYVFNKSSVIKFVDGVLEGHEINFIFYEYIPVEGLKVIEIFPDPFVANYVAVNRLGLADYNVVVTQEDLDRILYFGYDDSTHTYYSTSHFKGIEISSWDGLKFLRELKSIFLREFKGEARYIDISNSSKIVSLRSSFHSCPSNIIVKFPKVMNEVLSTYYLFGWTSISEVDVVFPEQMDSLVDMDWSFGGSNAKSIVFPKSLPNCTSIASLFANGQAPSILILPENMPKVTSLSIGSNMWDFLKEVYFPKVCPLVTGGIINERWNKVEKVYMSSDMPNLRNMPSSALPNSASIIFYEDNTVDSKSKLPYHDSSGNPVSTNHKWDYSRLLGLTFTEGDMPDKRLVGAIGVQEGKFKYWFADDSIKPRGIENVVNLNDNGAYYSTDGLFQGKVNYDSLYIGEGYENLFLNLIRYDYSGRKVEVEALGYNDYNLEIMRSENGDAIVHLQTDIEVSTDNILRFKIDNAPTGILVGLGDNGSISGNIQKDSDGYYRTNFNFWSKNTFLWFNNVEVGDKFRVYDIQVFTSNVVNFVNTRVHNGALSIPVDWELDTHSVIIRDCVYNNFVYGEGKYPIAFNSYSCYHLNEDAFVGAKTNILLSDEYKKITGGVNGGNINTTQYLASQNRIEFSVHDLPQLRYDELGTVLFYEGNLTKEEMESELEKNIIIPSINHPYDVPDYHGCGRGSRERIIDFFPDPVVAEYIALQLGYDDYEYYIYRDELDSVTWFGRNSLNSGDSWFKDKSVGSWEGTNLLKNIKNFYISGVVGTATEVDISNATNIENLNNSFAGVKTLTKVILPKGTSKLKSMESTFYNCYNLTSLDLSNLDTSNVTNMSGMFYICYSLTSLDLSNLDTSNVTNMNSMFFGCSSLTSLDLSSFNTSNVTNMSGTFYGCSSLTSLDLSSFNTSNVTNMNDMFSSCSKLTYVDLSSFNTSNVTNMSYMFYNCSSLTSLDLSNLDTSNVTNMSGTFYGCSSLTSLIFPAKFPMLTTALSETNLDMNGRTIIYEKDDAITSKSEIKFHNADGTPQYTKSTLDYSRLVNLQSTYTTMALSSDEYPTQLMLDDYDSVEVNGIELHPNRVRRIKDGTFLLPKEGKYKFRTYRDGKWTRNEYICLYSETMEDVVEEIEEADLLLIE